MVVDSNHSTPREMTFESARVGRPCYEPDSAFSSAITHWVTAVSFRNVMPSASSSSWWRPDTLSWVNQTWSPSLSAHGIWVNSLLSCQTAADSLMSLIRLFSYRKNEILMLCFIRRWLPSSTQSADVGDVLRFRTHPWWVDRLPPTRHLCVGDSGKPSGRERVDRTYKGDPAPPYSHWLQTSNAPFFSHLS